MNIQIDNAIFMIEKAEKDLQELDRHIPANRPMVLDGIKGSLYKAKEYLSTIVQQPLSGSDVEASSHKCYGKNDCPDDCYGRVDGEYIYP